MVNFVGSEAKHRKTHIKNRFCKLLHTLIPTLLFSTLMLAPGAFAQWDEPGTGGGGTSSEPVEPIVEWEKHQNADERLRAFGDDLMGDGIDPHTGGITFEHTDIVLPGNNGLDVSLKRRRSQGYLYHEDVDAEFGDWEYLVPRIKVVSAATKPWTGARCTSSYSTLFPTFTWKQSVTSGSEYSQGVSLDVPGFGAQQVLENPSGSRWPAGTTHATKGNWYLTCGSASDGGQGFIAKAPNGNTYRFDKFISHKAKGLGYVGAIPMSRYVYILAATEVTDVHGNWVRYTYDGAGRLTRIYSNDGRDITLTYVGSSKLVSTVNANGRQWQYSYRQSTFRIPFWEAWNYPQLTSQVLSSVVQPDGRSWTLNMDWMHAQPSPAENCQKELVTVTMTHPYGTTGTFKIKDLSHRYGYYNVSNTRSQNCPYAEQWPSGGGSPGYFPTVQTSTMAAIEKTLSSATMPSTNWTYTYEQDAGPSGSSGSDRTNWTKVQGPGTHITYYHEWPAESLGGKLLKDEIRASAGTAILKTTNYSYVHDDNVGNTFVYSPTSKHAVLTSSTSVQQDGDTFTTNTAYNTTSTSSTYSFGNPIQTSVYSNVSTTPRVTDTTYEHNKTKWILGLPKTVTTNGRNMATYVYNSLGQKTSETKNGAAYATYGYYTSGVQNGAMYWAQDALNRATTAFDWKRGTPQRIKRPDLISTYQYVDNNGWLTSTKDANGNTTSYSRDTMGRLTTYTPPAGWTPTTISYAFGTNTTQTISKGFASSVITYDSMFRPTLVKTTDSKPLVGSTSYVKTTYDAAGQAVFTSFPSASSNPTDGTTTAYDALGRVTSTAENVTPFATTLHHYFNANRHRVRDASGAETMYYRSGYSGPGKGPITATIQPTGITTYMYRNVWDELTSARQVGTQNNVSKDESHYYYYNNRRQLCRHYTPSGQGAVFAYDAAGQMTSYNRGVGSGTTCDTPAGNGLVDLTYDMLGRVIDTNYTDANTPDISRVYDNNGNVLAVNRGTGGSAVNWAYTYDNANNLVTENLFLDGRGYGMSYAYNPAGHMTGRSLPGGRNVYFINDGLGRMNKVSDIGQIYADNINYHVSGAISGMNYGNGQVFSQTLNARLQPLRMLSQKGSIKAIDLTYGYDVRGKVTGIVNGENAADSRTYNYDGLGRLTSATGPWGNSNYKYDALGNILEKKVGSRTIGMNYSLTNRLTSHVDKDGSGNDIAGTSVPLSYDTHGNVTLLGTQQFKYDMAEQPYEILGDVVGDYVYDGNLKRVKAVVAGKTIYTVYDASGTLVHVDEFTDGSTTDYIGKIARVKTVASTDTPTWLHMDHLGSAQTGSSATGGISWREQYTPYGTTLINPASNNDQAGFTGHIKDSATGLTYMQARYYDPLIGRFLSIDPVGFSVGAPQMFNRYSYTLNDPVNLIDRFGLAAEEPPKVKPPEQILKKPENTQNVRQSTSDKHGKGVKKKLRQEGPTKNKNKFDKADPVKGTTKKERTSIKKQNLLKKLGRLPKVGIVIFIPPGTPQKFGSPPPPGAPIELTKI